MCLHNWIFLLSSRLLLWGYTDWLSIVIENNCIFASIFVLVHNFLFVHFVTFNLTVVEARNNLTQNTFFSLSLYSTHTTKTCNIIWRLQSTCCVRVVWENGERFFLFTILCEQYVAAYVFETHKCDFVSHTFIHSENPNQMTGSNNVTPTTTNILSVQCTCTTVPSAMW